MRLFLKTEKCWNVIEHEERPTTITVRNWGEMDERAMYFISISIENNQLPLIKRTTSARGAWEALRKHHNKATLSTKIRLLRKLYQTILPKGGNMEEHLSTLINYYDELCEIDHVVDDQQFLLITMTSVGEDYDSLITALDCRKENELTFDLVKSKLLDEYERKIKSADFEMDGQSVAAIKQVGKKYCDFCKVSGHIKKFCGKFDNWLAEKKKKDEKKDENDFNKINLLTCDEDREEYLF